MTTRSVGINSAGAYQVSGTPFLTGAQVPQTTGTVDGFVVSFPTVTKNMTIINKNNTVDLVIHFASRENSNVMDQKRYVTLSGQDSSISLAVKCRRVYISSLVSGSSTGSFELVAELTPITSDINYSGSIGVDESA